MAYVTFEAPASRDNGGLNSVREALAEFGVKVSNLVVDATRPSRVVATVPNKAVAAKATTAYERYTRG